MPYEPATRPPTDPKNRIRKNAISAKISRSRNKQVLDAYKAYHDEMEHWIPQLQSRYNQVLDLLVEARPHFDAHHLGVAMDKALSNPMPEIPDTVVVERPRYGTRGQPPKLARRMWRYYAAGTQNFNGTITQSSPPSALNFANQIVAVPDTALCQFDCAMAEHDMELWDVYSGSDSAYDSSSFSPEPSQSYNNDDAAETEALRDSISYNGESQRDEIFLTKLLESADSGGPLL